MITPSSPYTFLTTKPQKRLISTLHPERLYILPHEDIPTASLRAVVTYTDGTTEEHVLISNVNLDINGGQVREFDVSYAKRDYNNLNSAKTIKYFQIHLYKSAAKMTGGDYIQYYPYTPSSDQLKAIYYHNSWGGLDSLICEGDQQVSRQFQGDQTAIPLEAVYDGQQHQFRWMDPVFRTQQSVNTTNRPAAEIDALDDFFMLKRAYEYKRKSGGHVLLPIIPEQPEVIMPSSRSNIKKLSFSYRYAFEQRARDRSI